MCKQIDLTPFCGEMEWLNMPFVQSGRLAATDGRIAVVVPTDEPDTPPGKRAFPKIHELDGGYDWVSHEVPFRHPAETKDDECESCHGNKKETVGCAECQGYGMCNRCDCREEHECGFCCGRGYIYTDETCSECKGSGWGYEVQVYGGQRFKGKYIAKILKYLPNPAVDLVGTTERGVCMRFIFNGGYGYLMGLYDSKDRKDDNGKESG